MTIILIFLDKTGRKLHISSFTSFFLGFLGSGISEVVFLISLLFVCIAQKVSFKVFASMSEGRRERATQWFNFRFLLTKANSAGNYSSVVPNLGSFSFSCLKNKIAIYNFWASKILSPVVLFSLPHCVLTSAQSVRSNNSGASHERSTMKHNGLLWISPRCYILLCTSSRTDYKFHIRGIDLSQEFIKHLKQQSMYQKQN